ncbi:MAG: CRISPR-associated endonuclease Cas1 [Nitrososphaerales archaeon]
MTSLMNHEGRIATYYWSVLARVFNKLYPQFRFQKRGSKSYSWNINASDEVNALLNYGYAVLESEVRKAINSVGLDPTIGFLHETAPSKEPLVYDIQELFRWLIDFSIIELLGQKKLRKSDFITTENYHIRLTEKAAKLLLERISLDFNRKVSYKQGKNFTYQNILLDNVQQLSNYVLDKSEALSFKIPGVQIMREASLDIRKKIMDMTGEERKKLRINKSTLWYQRKNIAEGKRIKVYDKLLSKLI